MRAFSSCSKWGLLFVALQTSHGVDFCCRAQAPGSRAQQLWHLGLVDPMHAGSSPS